MTNTENNPEAAAALAELEDYCEGLNLQFPNGGLCITGAEVVRLNALREIYTATR